MEKFLGTDLAVTPLFVAHDASAIDLVFRARSVRGKLTPPNALEARDLGTLVGRENLAQALILRLLTPQGSLRALGHGDYGSRLHELIGQHKNESNRHLCRAFVLEAVTQEARVEPKAVALAFDPAAEQLDNFVLMLSVQPRAGGAPLDLSLEVGI